MSAERAKTVEEQDWYHGYRPKKDAKSLLKQPGDFLVRATDTLSATDIVISVLDESHKFVNITLKMEDNLWYIGSVKKDISKSKRFKTIVELVTHYMAHPPSKKLKLARVIPRPLWMLKHNQIKYDKELGQGNFCKVHKGTLTNGNKEIVVAVKISLSQSNASQADSEEAKEARKAMMHEAQIMSYYTHENIILFHGVACDVKPVLVIMEFCPGGDLQSHLEKRGKDISTEEKVLYSLEAVTGMNYLHSKNCIHRDLAARNCLISATGSVKIADFGLSKMRDEVETSEKKDGNLQLPVRWMAPESLKKPYNDYTTRSDVWSFGVMLYEIFNDGIKPWATEPDSKVILKSVRMGKMPSMPAKTPSQIADLVVNKIWVVEAGKRMTMKDLFCKLTGIYKANPVNDVKTLVLNKIPGVQRTTLLQPDETESEDSGCTDEEKKDKRPRTRGSRAQKKGRSSSSRDLR